MTMDLQGNHIMEEVLKIRTATKVAVCTRGRTAAIIVTRKNGTVDLDTVTPRGTAIQVAAVIVGNP